MQYLPLEKDQKIVINISMACTTTPLCSLRPPQIAIKLYWYCFGAASSRQHFVYLYIYAFCSCSAQNWNTCSSYTQKPIISQVLLEPFFKILFSKADTERIRFFFIEQYYVHYIQLMMAIAGMQLLHTTEMLKNQSNKYL